jgi:Tfp pilus assembly protein PilN
MNIAAATALGIDVSQTRIAVALIKKDRSRIRLIRSVSGPVPADAMLNGSVSNAQALARAIGRLKSHLTRQTVPAAVSLSVSPAIMQIMDMPAQVPENIRTFLEQQVKHFAALLGKKIALDFCAASPASSAAASAGRVLTVAADAQKVDEFVEALGRSGIVADSIEPTLLGCIRPLYTRRIEGKFDSNVVIGLLRNNCLTLCVFRKQVMDFVRSRQITEQKMPEHSLCQWVADQIKTVIQSYEVDTQGGRGPWEVTLVADGRQLPDDAQENLEAALAGADIQLLAGDDLSQTTIVPQSRRVFRPRSTGKPSLTAVGLAMKLLGVNPGNLGVNLLPARAVRLRAVRTRVLIAANVIAAMVLIVLLAAGSTTWKVNQLGRGIAAKNSRLFEDTRSLVEKKKLLQQQEKTLSAKLDSIDKMLGASVQTYWPDVLSDIALNRPKTVCVTNVFSRSADRMSVKGLAVSNEDVYLFVNRLNQSEHIGSAALFEAKKDKDSKGLVNFEIRCALNEKGGA